MSLLPIGVIGCGRIARQVHLPILRTLPNVRIVALAEMDANALESAHQLVPQADCFSDAGSVLNHSEVEAVVIALPNTLHATTAIEAFAHGKHVYLEKPLALTCEEGQQVVTAWKKAAKVGAIGFNYRFNPLLVEAQKLLKADAIGPLVAVRSSFCTPFKGEPQWKTQRASGGGVLFDLASHHVDLVEFLAGHPVVEVWAQTRSVNMEMDTATIELRLQNGVLVQELFSQSATERDAWEFEGQNGRLRVERYTMSGVEITRPGELGLSARLKRTARENSPRGIARTLRYTKRKLREPNHEPSYRVALSEFVNATQNTPSTHLATPQDGLRNLEIITALETSARTGVRVQLSFPIVA
ncbi:glucose--fructose oxidoreductase [Abditibacteriota bacterium]|nr:glucose--fructose oxidoreductase [Abditibacteriota bacterium]